MSYTQPAAMNLTKEFASLPVFQGVEPDVLRELMASAHTAQFQKGTLFLPLGAPVPRFYFMLEGWCGATKINAEGQEGILQIFGRGDFLLEATRGPLAETCPINLQALTRIHLITLSPGTVRVAIDKSPIFMANMLSASVRRCQDLRDHIEQLTLHTAEQRVGRFLLRMRFNASPEGKDIVLPFDKSLIAAYLGIKPETLSRVLQGFRERGFAVERSHLTLPSREALCDYCDRGTMRSCPFAAPGCCSSLQPSAKKPEGK